MTEQQGYTRVRQYRGKRLDNGEWIEGDLIRECTRKMWIVLSYLSGEYGERPCFDWHEVDPATVGQYTGLEDAFGRKIYEGDIIENDFTRRDDFCYKVVWYGGTGQWCFDPFMKGDEDAPLLGIEEFLQDWETVGDDDPSITVIGNIHDNPDLLEVQNE